MYVLTQNEKKKKKLDNCYSDKSKYYKVKIKGNRICISYKNTGNRFYIFGKIFLCLESTSEGTKL